MIWLLSRQAPSSQQPAVELAPLNRRCRILCMVPISVDNVYSHKAGSLIMAGLPYLALEALCLLARRLKSFAVRID